MKKSYIEREALMNVIKTVFHGTDPSGEEQHCYLKLHQIVRTAPDADVVEVVRCKDCKHALGNDSRCYHPDRMISGGGERYCCYGERREKIC